MSPSLWALYPMIQISFSPSLSAYVSKWLYCCHYWLFFQQSIRIMLLNWFSKVEAPHFSFLYQLSSYPFKFPHNLVIKVKSISFLTAGSVSKNILTKILQALINVASVIVYFLLQSCSSEKFFFKWNFNLNY